MMRFFKIFFFFGLGFIRNVMLGCLGGRSLERGGRGGRETKEAQVKTDKNGIKKILCTLYQHAYLRGGGGGGLLLLGFILVGGTGDGPLASTAADAACATGAGAAGAWTALVLVKSFAFLGMCV